MTEDDKALALVNEVRDERGFHPLLESFSRKSAETEALCRAIEQHEAFRQEVSDAVEEVTQRQGKLQSLLRFIIAKPDPLVEAWKAEYPDDPGPETSCNVFRAVIEKRGGKIVLGEG